ncbi:MAG: carboxypeptidase-like regulatory domain-containing protein [Paludibacteraceae bacterium]|nr:carboxypeptidase-like regulatory domain-containing protein [Paludibacteraceae bacterium]
MRTCVRYILLLLMVLTACVGMSAASVTRVTGKVVEAGTGEAMPFTQIYFEGSQIGTTSDIDGKFEIQNERNLITICFRMLGYKTKVMTVKPGKTTNLFVVLEPEAMELEDVVVTPKRSRERYRRKGNPAVDLIKNVIANKDRNRVGHGDTYRVQSYEKLVMALEPFDYNLDKNAFWRDFKFLENYVDTMAFEDGVLVIDSGHVQIDSVQIGEDTTLVNVDSVVITRNEAVADTNKTTILTMSLRETMADEYVQTSPRRERKVITAKRWEGLDELLDNGNMSSNLQVMFQPMDIFSNDINLMLNRFVSPLSSSLAVSFYHYYIMDTVMIDGERCVDLAFVPVNSESFGFTGHLYITTDSTYALKRYKINVPPHINMNWLSHMSVRETFRQLEDGKWASEEVNTHVRFAIRKKSKHNIYARQTRRFQNYEVGVEIPDSLFYMAGDEVTLEGAEKVSDAQWDAMRPIELAQKELLVRNLQQELMSVPKFRALVNTIDDLIQEFIPTSRERDSSRWDFGPIFNTFSYNEQEGCRLRIGGMTTANLNPHWYTYVYAAYGFKDQRPKGGLTALYSFNKKKYYPYESLRHYIALQLSYDLEELGQTYRVLDRDHIFMSIKFNYSPMPMQYIGKIRLKYEKEWPNQFSVITWLDFMNNQPNGSRGDVNGNWAAPKADRSPLTMRYWKRQEDGTYIERPYYHDAQWTFQLRYSPGGNIYNDRQGIESPFNLWKDAPVFRFTNEMGYIFEDKYFYNRIQLSAESRIWLSAFGHLDISGDIGYIATDSKVPFTKLFIPTSNTSILLDPKAYNLMQPMEFLMDRYASLHMTYYLKGWIFNRIPGLNKLKLREVVSFHMLAGYLGDRNNPFKTDGLYDLPYSYKTSDGSFVQARTDFSDGKYAYMPYMELTAGIENIFKLIRIEYVRRLTHLTSPSGQKLGPWQRNGIRITLRVAM